MAHSQGKDTSSLACSFCGKPQHETRKLITGLTAYICGGCVGDALVIIRKNEGPFVAGLDRMEVLDFLREHTNWRAIDSIPSIRALVDRYEEVRAQLVARARPPAEPNREAVDYEMPPEHRDLSEGELTAFLSKQYGVPAIDLDGFEVSSEVSALIHEEVQRRHCLVPVNLVRDTLIIAMANPSSITAIDDVKFHTGYSVEAVVASEAAIRRKIDKHFPRPH